MYITERDKRKLMGILGIVKDEGPQELLVKISSLEVVSEEQAFGRVIGMNSLCTLSISGSQEERTVKLVYHFDDDLSDEKISIFSEFGIFLLGKTVGQVAHFSDGLMGVDVVIKGVFSPKSEDSPI